MLKKTLIGVVLLTMLGIMIVPVTAGELKRYDWPCEFAWVDINCEIPIYMNVGLYVEILDQDHLAIYLEQEDIDTYSGCCNIQIKCNFDLILGCYVLDNDTSKAMGGSFSCSIDVPEVPATLCNCVEEREVCVTYDRVGLSHIDYGKNIEVGTVIIQVKPAFECSWEDP
jgi:hypothetical protein